LGLVDQLNYRVLQKRGTDGPVKVPGALEESAWWTS